MGLAPLIVYLKTIALRHNDESYNRAARFWAKIFGINFVLGVVTGDSFFGAALGHVIRGVFSMQTATSLRRCGRTGEGVQLAKLLGAGEGTCAHTVGGREI
jgi:hypothetical protein